MGRTVKKKLYEQVASVIETLRSLGEAPWRLGRLIARGRKAALNLTGTLAAERE